MSQLNRRELLKSSSLLLAASQFSTASPEVPNPTSEWIRVTRTLIAEGCNPPFYPSLDYAAVAGIKLRSMEIMRNRGRNRLRHRNKCCAFRGGADGFVCRARLRAIVSKLLRLRITARALSLLRAGQSLPLASRDGWLDVTVPRVWIHDAVKVDLA
jgi:hypothetical protein